MLEGACLPNSAIPAMIQLAQKVTEDENKVFYLFTRTAREKEEWFNHLLVAAQFMEDWERQNPKEGSPVDQEYETQKVREQKFKIFMEDYPQAKNSQEAYKRHEEMKSNPELYACAKDQMAFVNVFLGRMWHDLHSNKDFIEFLPSCSAARCRALCSISFR